MSEPTRVQLYASRGAGKTQTLIESLLAQANERGIHVEVVYPQGKPTPDGWFPFGSHAPYPWVGLLEFSDEKDESGLPLWERPVQGESCEMCRWERGFGARKPLGHTCEKGADRTNRSEETR